jgi:F-type H+-transporting ATPase subunit epsilon
LEKGDDRYNIMEGENLTVTITTPQKEWTFEQVTSCSAPGIMGGFQILQDHAPLISELEIGEIKIETRDGTEIFATSGGFLEVLKNKVSILLETCEIASDIDLERAEKAAERARKRIHDRLGDLDILRAEMSLKRALNRIKVGRKLAVTSQ